MRRPITTRRECGSISIFAAVVAIGFIGVTALGIDVGYGLLTKAQLQNVADSAALAGNHQLARLYDALGNRDTSTYTLTESDKASIIRSIQTYALRNEAGGKAINVLPGDVLFGRWNRSTGEITPTDTGVNVIRVVARRDGSANGVLSTLMSSTIGVHSFDVRADASAVLTPVDKVPPGGVGLPVGIAKAWFNHPGSPCGGNSAIRLYPTGTLIGCAGWHTYTDAPASASKLHSIIDGIRAGTFKSPGVKAGDSWIFQGGVDASVFPDLRDLWRQNRDSNNEWKVLLPVYDNASCENVSGWTKIVGFATAVITNVTTSPAKQIDARVDCDVISYGEAGGEDYGTHVAGGRLID
ncbi:MAG TPA: pilus assembly protein TadG-related protein [Candidatus Limnocylindrales bacterium]|nr:pilus assembly protein TadG-related protein [Candidatus Limnocylindrales bacterium]